MNRSNHQLTSLRSWRPRFARIGAISVPRSALLVPTFVILTMVMLWPLPLHAGNAVQDLGDPLYEIWTMRWIQHQIVHDPTNLWDGNTGYPFPDSLLFSEPRISTSVIAWPIQLLTRNDILSYNLMLMGSYVVVGLGMMLLIWELTGELGAASLAGFISAFAPYRFGHLSHLNLLSYGWSLLALWSLVRFARRRSLLDALLAALFLIIQVLASDTLGLMAGFMAGTAVCVLVWQERKRLTWGFGGGLTAILVFPALAELPIALARLRVDRMYGFTRDLITVSQFSATLESYVSVSPGNHFWETVGILPVAYPNPLFPGTIAVLMALVGLLLGARRWPHWVAFAGFIAIVGVALSLGPYSSVGDHRYHLPYYFLYQNVPGFDAMRDTARFGMLALIGVEILAGLGLAVLWKLIRARLPNRRSTAIGSMMVILLLIGAAVEMRTDVGTVQVPNDPTTNAVYDWLARQPTAPVMEFPANGLWANISWTTREIYASTRHWDPIVAAYTSFVPQRDIDMLVAIHGGTDTPSLVSAANVGLLQDLKIHYIVIHHWPGYDWRQAVAEAGKSPELTRVGDIGDATVYTLSTGNRIPVSYDIVAPDNANAGESVLADLVARNDNPTGAINWLHLDPAATATWQSDHGATVTQVDVPLHLAATTNPGLTSHPIVLRAPDEPGRYHLTISCPAMKLTLQKTVVVAGGQSVATSPSYPDMILRRLTIEPGPHRPGDRIRMMIEWEVRQNPSIDLHATIQLLNEQNKPFAQWDGLPLGPTLQTSKWNAGTILVEPVLVPIPADSTAKQFRIMVALYDESSPTLKRITIQRPDGSTDLQYFSDPVPISSSTR